MAATQLELAVAALGRAFMTTLTEVVDGTYGPVATLKLEPNLDFSANVTEPGVVITSLAFPGFSLAVVNEAVDFDASLEQTFNDYLDWQQGERFALIANEMGGAIEGAPQRVPKPKPLVLRGTVMTVQEALVGFLSCSDEGHDELRATLDEPSLKSNTEPVALDDHWVFLVGVVG